MIAGRCVWYLQNAKPAPLHKLLLSPVGFDKRLLYRAVMILSLLSLNSRKTGMVL